jgi:hypothetical protein
MSRNLADAIIELGKGNHVWKFHGGSSATHNNQIQAQGSKLEEIVKDILCGVVSSKFSSRQDLHTKYLAHEGEANNPPDAMYRGGDKGDAFEIKKIDKASKTSLELNSSYPYSYLTSDMNRLTDNARNCEIWSRRDLFYAIGNIQWGRQTGNWLWFVEGGVFAQDATFYDKIESDLKPVIAKALRANSLTPSPTNELGRANKVDLLQRTNLRVRGMWIVNNPTRTFSTLNGVKEDPSMHFVAHILMRKSKWESLLMDIDAKEMEITTATSPNLKISDVQVDDPNSENSKLQCKLVRIQIK